MFIWEFLTKKGDYRRDESFCGNAHVGAAHSICSFEGLVNPKTLTLQILNCLTSVVSLEHQSFPTKAIPAGESALVILKGFKVQG